MNNKIAITAEKNEAFFEMSGGISTYGGNQDWFSSAGLFGRKTSARMANTGCGSISAANIIYHIAQNTSYGKGMLPKNIPTKQDFCKLAAQMYFIHTPQTMTLHYSPSTALSLGVWYVETIVRGVVHFSASRGVRLRGYSCNTRNSSQEEAASFIRTGLSANSPVVLLVYFNTYIRALGLKYMSEMHFVVITGIVSYQDEVGEDWQLIISNHGMRQVIPSLRRLWNANGLYIMPKASLSFAAKMKN